MMNAALLLIVNFSQTLGTSVRLINGKLAEAVFGVIEGATVPDGVRNVGAHTWSCMAEYAPARSMLTLLLDIEPDTFAAIKGAHVRATLVMGLSALLAQSPIIFESLSADQVIAPLMNPDCTTHALIALLIMS